MDPANEQQSTGRILMAAQDVLPTPEALLHAAHPRRPERAQRFAAVIAESLEIARPLIEPRAVWARKAIGPGERPELSPWPETLPSHPAFHFGVVCTIGARLEARSQDLFQEKSYSLGYWLDQIGTYAVARCAQETAGRLCSAYGAIHWAPGDLEDDSALEQQQELFAWVPAVEIGVCLTETRFMLPAKSLSFNLYAGSGLHGVKCRATCARCVWNGSCGRR